MSTLNAFTFRTTKRLSMDETRALVEVALKAEGFGVLTVIDVAATLRAKLGVERLPYLILGACNPRLAHAAIEIEPSIGALLPCNVVLRQDEGSDRTRPWWRSSIHRPRSALPDPARSARSLPRQPPGFDESWRR